MNPKDGAVFQRCQPPAFCPNCLRQEELAGVGGGAISAAEVQGETGPAGLLTLQGAPAG